MPLTEEQKQRKNEKAKENRLKKKMEKAQSELVELEATKLPEPDIIENIEDPDEVQKRKMEIAEKRRKTLEIARSKRVTPTQIRKKPITLIVPRVSPKIITPIRPTSIAVEDVINA